MDTTTTPNSRHDGLVAAIGVIVLLLGAATDNAYAMFVLAICGLAVMAIVYRQKLLVRKALLATTVAATVAAAAAVAAARL
jgi:hypothetical protein